MIKSNFNNKLFLDSREQICLALFKKIIPTQ